MIQKKIFHQNQEFDHDLSRFYVKNNEIIGCMLFKVQKNNNEIDILSMFLLHMDEKAENGLAFPAMLADCVVAANEKYADETVLELGIFLPQLCEALCNVLGEPEQEEYFQQYLRIL